MNRKLTILILTSLLVFVQFIPITIQVKANPISPLGISMYEEYINVNIWASNETAYARVYGLYLFSKNEIKTIPMSYPLPPDSTNISLLLDGNEIPWQYSNKTYETAIGNFSMIRWMIDSAPVQFNIEVLYEHQIPVLDRNYTYLYQMRTEMPSFYGTTRAYISVTINFPVFNPNAYVVSSKQGNWTWNLDYEQRISRANGIWTIETTRMSTYRGFEGDFALTFKRPDIYVPKDYLKIQEAIDAANQGGIISVSPGTYNGYITINKTITLYGEDRINTIIRGNWTEREWMENPKKLVSITGNNVHMIGFTVQNSNIGLYLSNTTNSVLEEITVSHCDWGIYISGYSPNNMIANCELLSYTGISIWSSDNNTIINNTMLAFDYGIDLKDDVSGNNITNNRIMGKFNDFSFGIGLYGHNNSINRNVVTNFAVGMSIWKEEGKPSYNIVTDNNVSHCLYDGIRISSTYTIVSNNSVTYNGYAGIVTAKDNNMIFGNTIMYNKRGLYLINCENHTIYRNNIIGNDYGFYIGKSVYNNRIYQNNIIDNKKACYIDGAGSASNKWDNGYPSGGNYWGDYNGTDLYSGRYQNETGSDYIGDTYYRINDVEADKYPLMTPYDSDTYGAVQRYIELRVDYNVLYSLIHDLAGNHTLLVDNFNDLNMTYHELLDDYNTLQAFYNQLQSGQEDIIKDLNNIQNLMYVFVATSIVFIIVIAYLGMKTTQKTQKTTQFPSFTSKKKKHQI